MPRPPVQFADVRSMAREILGRAGAPLIVAWIMLMAGETILQIALATDPAVRGLLRGELAGPPEPTTLMITVLLALLGAWRVSLWRPLRRAVLEGQTYRSARAVLGEARAMIPTAIGLFVTHQLLGLGALALCLALEAPILFFILFPLQIALETVLYFGVARDMRPREAYAPGLAAVRSNWGATFGTHAGILLLWVGFSKLVPPQAMELGPLALFSLYVSLTFFSWLSLSALNLSLDQRS